MPARATIATAAARTRAATRGISDAAHRCAQRPRGTAAAQHAAGIQPPIAKSATASTKGMNASSCRTQRPSFSAGAPGTYSRRAKRLSTTM